MSQQTSNILPTGCDRQTINQLCDQLQWMQLKTETDVNDQQSCIYNKIEKQFPHAPCLKSITHSEIFFQNSKTADPKEVGQIVQVQENIINPQPIVCKNQCQFFDDFDIQSVSSSIYGFRNHKKEKISNNEKSETEECQLQDEIRRSMGHGINFSRQHWARGSWSSDNELDRWRIIEQKLQFTKINKKLKNK